MIRRPSDFMPDFLLDEFRRLARMKVDPVLITPDPANHRTHFVCHPMVKSWYVNYCKTGQDYAVMLAHVRWLREGPKIVDVTDEQYDILSRVEVRLRVRDFRMPYPSLLVNMPAGRPHQYALLNWSDSSGVPILLGCSIQSMEAPDNIIIVIQDSEDTLVEEFLGKYRDNITQEEGEACRETLRVACNMALAMTHFGCQAEYIFPKEVAQERKYVAKGDRAGRSGLRASDRLREQPMVVTFDREVELCRREVAKHEPGEPTGREMPFHYRSGHWRRLNDRTVFVRPCVVRADKLAVAPDETTTTYTR